MSYLKTLKTIFTNKLFYLGMLFVMTFGYVYEKLPVRIDYTLDNCLPYSFWITRERFSSKTDEYFMFIPPVRNIYTQKAQFLVKQIGCREGQKLETKGLQYFCDDKLIGTAKPYSSGGLPLSRFVFNGIIPEDSFFATASHPYAYDSKYFGFVKRKHIVRGATPVF